jgi:hypothetical protein
MYRLPVSFCSFTNRLIFLDDLDPQSSLFDLSYNTSSSLVSELSENTMVLLQGDLSSDRIQRLELIVSKRVNSIIMKLFFSSIGSFKQN